MSKNLRFNSAATDLILCCVRHLRSLFPDDEDRQEAFAQACRERGVNVDQFKWIVGEINALKLKTVKGEPLVIDSAIHSEPGISWREKQAAARNSEQSSDATAAPVPGIDIPHRRNPFFTGRARQLELLERELRPSNAQLLAINGLGGVGKTQLAVEYAYRYGARHSHILWSSADTESSLADGYHQAANSLGLKTDYSDPQSAIKALTGWMSSERHWVLFLDNADHPHALDRFIPGTLGGQIVLTSRAQNFDRLGNVNTLALDVFTIEESIEFLAKRTRRSGLSDTEQAAAAELAEELGGLALALEQAGSFLAETGAEISSYLQQFRRQGLAFLESSPPQAGVYSATVASTWFINFREVADDSPASIELLRTAAYLRSPDHDPSLPIPFSYLTDSPVALDVELAPNLRRHLIDAEDPTLALAQLLRPLTRFSLATLTSANESFAIHPLVLEVIRAYPEL